MRLINREGRTAFDHEPDATAHRTPGVSTLVRVKDEEDWIERSLHSVLWADEIVVTLNDCADATPQIVERFRAAHPSKVIVRSFPFPISAMGPGHDKCPDDSIHASAFFYNFTQSLSTRTHCLKWDGDCIGQDWLGDRIRERMASGHERIKIFGVDLASDLRHVGNHRVCPSNGIYRVAPGVRYVQAPLTQSLRGVPPHTAEVHDCFIHTKWIKPMASATKQWPKGWEEMPHFQNIAARRHPVAPYRGEYPASVRALLNRDSA